MLAPPPRAPIAFICSCAAVAAPTLIRLAIDHLVIDVTYVTYYPFILGAAMFMGWRYASGVALASAVAGNYLFMAPRHTLFAFPEDTVGSLFFLLAAALVIAAAEALRQAYKKLHAAIKRRDALNAELQHRVKNIISVAQALAIQAFRDLPEADVALATFTSRLRALATAQDVLTGGNWEICKLPDLADQALAPFNHQGTIYLSGPDCTLPERSCVPLVLALHELGTNAAKYGALSAPHGSVAVVWTLREDGEGGDELVMRWTEQGGPRVQPPTRRGLGSRLLAAQSGLKAVTLDYAADGVTCEIVVAGADFRPPRG
jgi:two-component sensor histidine kinase